MVAVPVVLSLIASVSLAGGECRPPKDSSDAKLLSFFAAPISFSPAGLAERMTPGSVRLSFDVTYVPTPSADIRRASYCNRKSENTELSSFFPRPRLAVGLPGGLYVEGSYLPPITVMDATPNLGSVAVGWSRSLSAPRVNAGAWLTLRAHATFGHVEGPITCPSKSLQLNSTSQPCYGSTASDDRYSPGMMGVEGLLGWTSSDRFAGYVGTGYTSLKPRFQVNFTPAGGVLDDTKVLVDLSRAAVMAGGRYAVAKSIMLTGEVYSVPSDVTTVRVGASWTLRGSH